jgi:hypothetical protein
VVERGGDISEHRGTGQCSRNRPAPQIALRRFKKMPTLGFPLKSSVQPFREIRGWLNGRKISEKEKRAADFGVLLRTALAFSDMTLHADQLDTSESIVYERDVLITKLTTIHEGRLRVR